jgi:hypothetical protein
VMSWAGTSTSPHPTPWVTPCAPAPPHLKVKPSLSAMAPSILELTVEASMATLEGAGGGSQAASQEPPEPPPPPLPPLAGGCAALASTATHTQRRPSLRRAGSRAAVQQPPSGGDGVSPGRGHLGVQPPEVGPHPVRQQDADLVAGEGAPLPSGRVLLSGGQPVGVGVVGQDQARAQLICCGGGASRGGVRWGSAAG